MRSILRLTIAIAFTVPTLHGAEQLGDIYRINATGCPAIGNTTRSSTGFTIAGKPPAIFTTLHSVNGCRIVWVTRSGTTQPLRVSVCWVAIEHDIALLNGECTVRPPAYTWEDNSSLKADTLYVSGFPLSAGELQRPVFLFRHGAGAITELQTVGLPFNIRQDLGLLRDTPVFVIGASIAPGDSGAPLFRMVGDVAEVVGVVNGGRREQVTKGVGGLIGITWAVALGPRLLANLKARASVEARLIEISLKPVNEFFANPGETIYVRGVEFVRIAPSPESGQRPFWIMATEATQGQYYDCVGDLTQFPKRFCGEAFTFSLASATEPALLGRVERAKEFCTWLGGGIPNQLMWLAVAMLPQRNILSSSKRPFIECRVNLKGFPSCPDNQRALPARSSAPNEIGVYDLFGNVWEWIQEEGENPRVAGGAFNTPHQEMCTADGDCSGAIRDSARAGTIGVRCVLPDSEVQQ